MKFLKKNTLSRKMNLLAAMVMVPLTLLILYLLINLINFSTSYNQSVKNITAIKDYTLNFKTDLDYSVYRAVSDNLRVEDLAEYAKTSNVDSAQVRDPYQMINELRNAVNRQECSQTESADLMRRVSKSLGWLERIVQKIDENIKEGGHYADNIDLLDKDIRSSTQLIQDNLQAYTYYEAVSLEHIRSQLEKRVSDTLLLCMGILLTILAVDLVLTRRITRSVTQPIRELCMATRQVAKGNFSPAEIESGDEIQVLTNSFNDMTGEIQYLIENIKKEQKNLRDTELRLLQAQINPHFLYNTLDAIVWMAEGGQDAEVVSMVTALSEFFRTTLSEGKDYITIREEESHIRSYLEIQEFRYADILEYEINIDPQLYNYGILKLTLQPLVENALYHGIKNKRGKGKITVRGYAQGGDIIFEVRDNGIGMDEEELSRLNRTLKGEESHDRGFGLGNVNERIRLNYGSEYGITFHSVKGEGTVATVRIPKKNIPFPQNNEQKKS